MHFTQDSELRSHSPDVSKATGMLLRTMTNLSILLLAVTVATLLSLGLERIGLSESNFIMIYMLGVVFVAYITEGYLYSIAASILSVLTFNFFFTVPYFTFQAYGRDYPLTFAVMFLVVLITSSMTARNKVLKKQSENRELRLRFLNRMIRNLTTADNFHEIAEIAAGEIAAFLDASAIVAIADAKNAVKCKYVAGEYPFDSIDDEVALLNAFRSETLENARSLRFYSSPKAYFLPIKGQDTVLGAMGVSFKAGQIAVENIRTFLATVCIQVSFALEREQLRLQQEQAKLQIEKERLRTNLLHGISHDLRTPLTGILGSAGALRDHFATLDDKTKIEFVKEIIEEAEWLKQMVENTLYLTKVREEGVRLGKELQPVEEMVASAAERCGKRAGGANLRIEIPEEFIMVPADPMLIVQTLINLLDNAFKHSPQGAAVTLKVTKARPDVAFEVIDQGTGIAPDEVDRVCDRFFTGEKRDAFPGRQKGFGLGLTVCKSIVEAHGGKLSAVNNPSGGATFRFTLPMEEK